MVSSGEVFKKKKGKLSHLSKFERYKGKYDFYINTN